MKEIYLEKTNEVGNRQLYRYVIEGNRVTYEWGVIGGALQTDERVFTEGKNIGKANEKSPEQCCLEDTVTRARKKYEKGYEVLKGMEYITEHTSEVVKLSDVSIPKPMLAQTMKDHLKKLEGRQRVWLQPKLDGSRALVNTRTGKMYSRSRKPWPDHIQETMGPAVIQACAAVSGEVDWIDGELYSPELTFNDLQTALRRWKNIDTAGTRELQAKVKFYAFDVVHPGTWPERMVILGRVTPNDRVEIVETVEAAPLEIDRYHQVYVDRGFEGVMIRFDTLPYEEKRSMQLFKHKLFEDAEFIVVGFESQEHDSSKLGAVILEHPGTKERFNARPAMPDSVKEDIWTHQDRYIGRMATVKYQERDAKSDIPRFPVLTRFRIADDLGSEKSA